MFFKNKKRILGEFVKLIQSFKDKIDNFLLSPKARDDVYRAIDKINTFLNERENSIEYRDFVASVYKSRGFTVWEYSGEDRSLNLVLKKRRDIFLVTCRDDNRNISLEEVIDFEMEMELFLKEYRVFDNYNITFRYTISGLFLEEEAFSYIKENKKMDFDIIKKIEE
jgi:hypothetical protein